MKETDLCSSSYGRNGVLLIGRGVAYRKTKETDLCWSAYGRNGGPVHREGCGVPQNGTPRATVHPLSTASLQPPRATVHPPSTSSGLHLRLFIHGVSLLPPPAIVPPRGHVHPPPTGSIGVLFIQRQRPLLPRAPVHPTPTGKCSSNPQQRSLFI